MWKGIMYTAIFFVVIVLIVKLFFWMLPFLLFGGGCLYVYKKFISPKLNKRKKGHEVNYSYTVKNIDAQKQNLSRFNNKQNNDKVIDVEYKEINK